ncbi:hypothetical protein FQA39_LY19059 [Lamprigera yunnana]|nr:hypothetical protein FQA39_LY19059 [Lamprigera yunnana]
MGGCKVLVKALQAEGVEQLWGYPGGAVLYIYDALYKQDTINHVLCARSRRVQRRRRLWPACHGEVGVALVTSGPGLTNAVTGIATAYTDSIPIVVIAGQTRPTGDGSDAFQECDTVGITRPVVKHNFLVKDVRDLALTMKKAFHIARTGRPGPVVVDVPKDVFPNKKVAYKRATPKTWTMPRTTRAAKGHSGQIRKALQLLLTAKRPYIYTGGGVLLSGAEQELRTFRWISGTTPLHPNLGWGRAAFPASDKRFLGMLGMHGTIEANNAMQNSDRGAGWVGRYRPKRHKFQRSRLCRAAHRRQPHAATAWGMDSNIPGGLRGVMECLARSGAVTRVNVMDVNTPVRNGRKKRPRKAGKARKLIRAAPAASVLPQQCNGEHESDQLDYLTPPCAMASSRPAASMTKNEKLRHQHASWSA